jgi:hypothetical protein
MAKKKKPDLVVWNEEDGYYQRSLTYGSNLGAPAIQLEDISGWKKTASADVNKQFKSKFDELKAEYETLVEEYRWNDLIFKAQYSFKPVIGEIYHLYVREDETIFLSLIEPSSWEQKYIGSFKLTSTQKWKKIKFSKKKVR